MLLMIENPDWNPEKSGIHRYTDVNIVNTVS